MKTATARISSRYQVVIPKAVREALDLTSETSLLFLIDGDMVLIRPKPESMSEAMRGLHKEVWADSEGWLEDERAKWE